MGGVADNRDHCRQSHRHSVLPGNEFTDHQVFRDTERAHLNSLIEGRGRRRIEGPVALAVPATCFVDGVEDWPWLFVRKLNLENQGLALIVG